MLRELPTIIQDEILDRIDSSKEESIGKAARTSQARVVVKLRKKYNFRKNRLGLN
jgi:hypothetical protein